MYNKIQLVVYDRNENTCIADDADRYYIFKVQKCINTC